MIRGGSHWNAEGFLGCLIKMFRIIRGIRSEKLLHGDLDSIVSGNGKG